MPLPFWITEPVSVMRFDKVTLIDWLKVTLPVTSMAPVRLHPLCKVRTLAPPAKTMAEARVVPSPARPPAMAPLSMSVMPAPTTPAPPAPTAPGADCVPPSLNCA